MTYKPPGRSRVELLLNAQQGQARAEAISNGSPALVRLQRARRSLMDARGEFVRFKTTRRAHYDAFAPTQSGVFDTVLWNAGGEITECMRGNVAMLIEGRWVTPTLCCRAWGWALQDERLLEAVVRVEDLPRMQGWAFVNSLRGWIDARMG